ncbi:MAG: hypothetical protein ACI4IM_08870 [Acutalibacteraceae bacterium]
MALIAHIDSKADAKGPFVKTLWQFVKFVFVSLIAFFVQFFLLNTLKFIPFIQNLYGTYFQWWVFKSEIAAGGAGYFVVSTAANFLSRIVAFFVNRDKTFNSDAKISVALPIYIAFALALIAFLSWLNPCLKASFVNGGLGDAAASNAATMVCCCIQFFLYFPVDKLLFRKEKSPKSEVTQVAPISQIG